jgi:hypothetical protein
MVEPNFSESQLQSMVNTEIVLNSLRDRGHYVIPIIISLVEEYDLGWDTGFYFPWILRPGSSNHRGCNFFLQFKLANLIEGPRGGQYSCWHDAYLRFQLPHNSKDENTQQHFLDFHQYHRLRNIATQNYPVYYVANSVLYERELIALAQRRELLSETPFFDISAIDSEHRYLTYTRESQHGFLHSEPKQIKKIKWAEIIESYTEARATALESDIKVLIEPIRNFEREMEISEQRRIDYIFQRIEEVVPAVARAEAKAGILAGRLRTYFNLDWHKFAP